MLKLTRQAKPEKNNEVTTMTEITERELRKAQQTKFYCNHKQYKVYLDCEEDAELIRLLERSKNKSLMIKMALVQAFRKE